MVEPQRGEAAGTSVARALRAARTQRTVDGEDRQGDPDEGETDGAIAVEGFVEDEHADQELHRRRDVLQQADDRQRHATHRVGEAHQRQCGERAADDQQHAPCADAGAVEEAALPVRFAPREHRDGRQEQIRAFDAEAGDRFDRRELADQSVQRERSRERRARSTATGRSGR